MRQPAGIVWTEVRYRMVDCTDDRQRAFLMNFLLVALEIEFTEAVAFERELWDTAPSSPPD
jgi:hypothetical protein